jgi:large subunit ribosomal protein L21
MKYAVIQLLGKQFRVQEGEQIVVDRLSADAFTKNKLTVNEVLFVRNEADLKVGAPFVDGATVTLERVEDQRGEKIDIRQYKAKSRYRRHIGHRQEQTVVTVAQITA